MIWGFLIFLLAEAIVLVGLTIGSVTTNKPIIPFNDDISGRVYATVNPNWDCQANPNLCKNPSESAKTAFKTYAHELKQLVNQYLTNHGVTYEDNYHFLTQDQPWDISFWDKTGQYNPIIANGQRYGYMTYVMGLQAGIIPDGNVFSNQVVLQFNQFLITTVANLNATIPNPEQQLVYQNHQLIYETGSVDNFIYNITEVLIAQFFIILTFSIIIAFWIRISTGISVFVILTLLALSMFILPFMLHIAYSEAIGAVSFGLFLLFTIFIMIFLATIRKRYRLLTASKTTALVDDDYRTLLNESFRSFRPWALITFGLMVILGIGMIIIQICYGIDQGLNFYENQIAIPLVLIMSAVMSWVFLRYLFFAFFVRLNVAIMHLTHRFVLGVYQFKEEEEEIIHGINEPMSWLANEYNQYDLNKNDYDLSEYDDQPQVDKNVNLANISSETTKRTYRVKKLGSDENDEDANNEEK